MCFGFLVCGGDHEKHFGFFCCICNLMFGNSVFVSRNFVYSGARPAVELHTSIGRCVREAYQNLERLRNDVDIYRGFKEMRVNELEMRN